ncbi:hypothetical protein DICPUDRAFT_150171 [Dictyostelium purpureum]|uniref:B box-type domain-containing protein n=1 Tax=Dictyostelium purpureum TaxID=5786 RepID=F0ZFM4_DICPU|nr:uncharacterized protein DICPUDRAFT_150171 [Dictyostelium purpureum]EGC37256.1 hypothetical protein DICPUDRAFT_150171 [Dictyostelium purpureum]|eukprot:XP_003286226.1 hypothetical protein DICPUDRAFT_150171 [Dictyostelium purpureum]
MNININKTRKKTNSINSNTSDNPNLKCYYHDLNDLITYCLDCSKMVCVQCIVSSDHTGHKYAEISKQFASNVLDKFKNQKYQNLVGFRESDRYIKNAVDYCYSECDTIFKNNCQNVRDQFKEIRDHLDNLENQVIEQLKITYQKNLDSKHTFKSQLDFDTKKIDSIINRHQNKIKDYSIDNVFNFETKQHIEIIKDSDLCDPIIKKREQTQTISFEQDILTFDTNLINTIKDSISNIVQIKTEKYKDNKNKKHLMMNKIIQPYNINYYLCHGEPIPSGITSIALDSRFSFNSLEVPSTVDRLLLCNGFNLSLSDFKIPPSIKTLRIGDIKQPLEPFSGIPSSVTELHLCDGFNHSIEENMIPSSVKRLNIYDIKQPLSMYSIPQSVEELTLCDSFNQSIGAFVIPDSVKVLSLGDIKHRVMNEFIPSSVKKIRLYDGYTHSIPQNINDSIESLVLFNVVDQHLEIPESIKELHLCDGFNHPISSNLLPNKNLEKLVVYNIRKPLEIDSIPPTVKSIVFFGYNHPLLPGTIKDTVKSIYFNNYNYHLDNNIIPNNIEIIKK